MNFMFKALGALLAFYIVYAIVSGRVYARSGITGRWIMRQETPNYFWTVVVIYAGLSLALVFIF